MNHRLAHMITGLVLIVASFTIACSGDGPKEKVLSYVSSDACRDYQSAEACAVDDACAWIEVACPPDADCEQGACLTVDPCAANASASACEADASDSCNWIESDLLCPPGVDCGQGGFCVGDGGDACVCACPLGCPVGEDCPSCECECDGSSGGGSGGGTCTCGCPVCPEGEVCPPCDCECTDEGCVDQGTCTCSCADCPEGETCPPCDCQCEGEPGTGGGDFPPPQTGTTCSCECPACGPNEVCTPCECDCEEPPPDPCVAHEDEDSCIADQGNSCEWLAIGAPCQEGAVCPGGACYSTGGDDCTCACPACGPNEVCSPCVCDCSGGGGDSCVPGGEVDPAPAPMPTPTTPGPGAPG